MTSFSALLLQLETQTINQQTSEKEKQKEKENIKGIKDQEKQASTSESLDYQRDLKTFREALAELRDPIVPVRAHGIRELAKLCRKNSTVAQENHTKISDLLLTLLSGSSINMSNDLNQYNNQQEQDEQDKYNDEFDSEYIAGYAVECFADLANWFPDIYIPLLLNKMKSYQFGEEMKDESKIEIQNNANKEQQQIQNDQIKQENKAKLMELLKKSMIAKEKRIEMNTQNQNNTQNEQEQINKQQQKIEQNTHISNEVRLALSEVVLKTLQRKFNIIPHFAPLFFEPLFTMASKANLYQQTKQSKDSHNSIQQSSAMVVLACLCELWGSGVQQVVQRVASLAERTLQLPSSADVQRRASALLFTSLLRALLPKDNERESDVMGATISSAQQIYGDNETPLSMLTPTFVPQYANRYHSSQSSSDSQDPFTLSQQHFHSSSSSSSFSILNAHIDILIRAQTQFEIHSDQSMEKDETVRKHCLIGISVINDCKNVLRRIPEIGEDKQESNTVTDNLIFTQIFAGHI